MKKKETSQADLFEESGLGFLFDPSALKTEAQRIEAQARFIIERHRVYLKKTAGLPKPWTDDPVLRTSKFTNIYRELDPVTVWIFKNIIKPYQNHPDLWFMLCIARIINWPDTLQELMDEGVWPEDTWDPKKVYNVLSARQKRKEKFITNAYVINSVFPKGYMKIDGTKAEYIPMLGLDPLYKRRKELMPMFKTSMAEACAALTSQRGWGMFMSNQVAVDLSYSKKWLGNAPDLNTFTSPGPGTTRGMNWVLSGSLRPVLTGDRLNADMQRLRILVNRQVKKMVKKSEWTDDFRTGFAEISMPNYSNCNCETSKMVRSILDGDTSRMKNKYPGV